MHIFIFLVTYEQVHYARQVFQERTILNLEQGLYIMLIFLNIIYRTSANFRSLLFTYSLRFVSLKQ